MHLSGAERSSCITHAAAADAARQAQRQVAPVSVLISRKTQKLYVRQSFEPIFDAPITITSYQPAFIAASCRQVPYATVWKFHTVAYGHGGSESKRPAAPHPR